VEYTGYIRLKTEAFSPTMAVYIQSQVSSCGICGGQSDTGAGFIRVLGFPCQFSFHQLWTQLRCTPPNAQVEYFQVKGFILSINEPTPWSRTLLEKQLLSYYRIPHLLQSLKVYYSIHKRTATGPYIEPHDSSSHPHTISLSLNAPQSDNIWAITISSLVLHLWLLQKLQSRTFLEDVRLVASRYIFHAIMQVVLKCVMKSNKNCSLLSNHWFWSSRIDDCSSRTKKGCTRVL
jgi:hypothetical protein